jgi:hypothetical protein
MKVFLANHSVTMSMGSKESCLLSPAKKNLHNLPTSLLIFSFQAADADFSPSMLAVCGDGDNEILVCGTSWNGLSCDRCAAPRTDDGATYRGK